MSLDEELATPSSADRPRGPAGAGTGAARGRRRAAGPGAERRKARLSKLDLRLSPYLYIAPFFLLFSVFGIFPLLYTSFVSLHDWDLLGSGPYVGMQNYRELLADEYFWNAVVNTFGIFVLATVPQLLMALGLASLLNSRLRARTFWRMGVLLPNITSVATVAIIFSQFYGRDFGILNWLIGLVGVEPIDWQAHRWSSWIAISTMVDWRWTGYNALIYLAALQAVPHELYEAAAIDGAGKWRRFWTITVPLLRPTIIFTVVVATIGGMQLFTEPLLFDTNPAYATGGSGREFQTLALFLYEQAFKQFRLGYAAAVAWLLLLLMVLVSAVNYLLVRRISSSR
jgi:cellobiose transport system permease protein